METFIAVIFVVLLYLVQVGLPSTEYLEMDNLLSVSAVENQAGHLIAKVLVFITVITNKEKYFTYHKCRKKCST